MCHTDRALSFTAIQDPQPLSSKRVFWTHAHLCGCSSMRGAEWDVGAGDGQDGVF